MALKRAKATVDPTAPLVRPSSQPPRMDAPAVIAELRQIHENAEDPRVERMPGDDELWGALLYLEEHASVLDKADEKIRAEAAVKRAALWEYLRAQIDSHQLKAVDQARAAGAEWARIAPALAVRSPSAAFNKAARLRATSLTDDDGTRHGRPVRRTPEAVAQVLERKAQAAAVDRRREAAARSRHQTVLLVARSLLDHRADLADAAEVQYWLDEMREVLTDCTTATQMVSLETYVGAVARELQLVQRAQRLPAARTEAARMAFSAAVEIEAG